MSLLTVEPTGLQALSTCCESWSAHVAASSAPSAPPAAAQATAAAVTAVHGTTGATGTVLGTRMTATGGQLGTAASEFAKQDAEDASVLAQLPVGA